MPEPFVKWDYVNQNSENLIAMAVVKIGNMLESSNKWILDIFNKGITICVTQT